jgi:hypothetical protein
MKGVVMVDKKTIDVKLFSWFDDRWYKVRYINEMKVEVEEYFASVTTKLGALDEPFIRRWYGQVGLEEAMRVLREAGDRGTRLHWAWQFLNNGGAIIYDPDRGAPYDDEELAGIKKYYNGNFFCLKNQDEMFQMDKLKRWLDIVEPIEVKCEQIVYNIEEKDAGTLDNLMLLGPGVYEINGSKPLKLEAGWYVCDLKTGSTISAKAKMQIARYSVMCEKLYAHEKHPIEIVGALILHTSASMRSGIEGLATVHIPREELLALNQDYLDIAKVWNRQCKSQKPKVRQLPALIAK